ncbi:unnamed protein product [Diamesa tonsa]
MVVTSEIAIPPRRNSFNAPELATKSPTQKWWHFSTKLKPTNTYGGSTVAVQKLRESKWFNQDEERLFCSVIEGGFIVEMVTNINNDSKSLYGVVSVDHKKNKKPTAGEIHIYTVNKCDNRLKVIKMSVMELWRQGYKLRINNINDKHKPANSEKDIKCQTSYAIKHRILFHNSLHFVDFCRYGPQVELRKRQMSEQIKYGSLGMNAGIFFLQREKSHSFSK